MNQDYILDLVGQVRRIINSVDHILGSDEIQDLDYYLTQIEENLVESES